MSCAILLCLLPGSVPWGSITFFYWMVFKSSYTLFCKCITFCYIDTHNKANLVSKIQIKTRFSFWNKGFRLERHPNILTCVLAWVFQINRRLWGTSYSFSQMATSYSMSRANQLNWIRTSGRGNEFTIRVASLHCLTPMLESWTPLFLDHRDRRCEI